MIKSFGALSDNSIYKFKFKEGINYTLSNNGLIATKTSGGDSWNCTIIGDKEIPKNKISKIYTGALFPLRLYFSNK